MACILSEAACHLEHIYFCPSLNQLQNVGCFLTSSSLCWCHQCAGGSMTPVLPLSSVEVLVLHDAGSWGTMCLESACMVVSSISPNFEPKQYLTTDLQTSC